MKYFPVMLIFIAVISCDWRTPSRDRFSDYCNIKIPENVEIIKDEYHDRIQDYAITYEIKLSQEECSSLIQSIKSSVYFNPGIQVNDEIKPSMYKFANGEKALWFKTVNGFEFRNDKSRTKFYAKVDTVGLIAKFEEWYD